MDENDNANEPVTLPLSSLLVARPFVGWYAVQCFTRCAMKGDEYKN